MRRLSLAAFVLTAFTALAQGAPPDMSTLGPWSRKVTTEAAAKKEIQAFYEAEDALMKAKNWDALIARVDFPVFMSTDNAQGVVAADPWDRARYVNEMKPIWESAPADSSTKHKLTVTMLSDSLANVIDDFTITSGKQTMKGRNASLLVKIGGQWRFKAVTEAGWGDMGAPPAAAPAPATPAPPPARK